MSYARAINEIAGLLTQAGTPANHANDIAARLSYAMSSYYDMRQASLGRSDFNANSANTSSFKSVFRAPESMPGGAGAAGRDGEGAYAWAVGGTGAAGAAGGDGQDGQQGEAGTSGRDGASGTSVGLEIKKQIDDLKKRIEELEKAPPKSYCPKCCKGMFYDRDPCAILEQQANEISKLRKKIEKDGGGGGGGGDTTDLEDRLTAVEQAIAYAVECP